MPRAHLRYTLKDSQGNAIQNARVKLFEVGTTTPIIDAWTDPVTGTNVSELLSNTQGEVEAWLATPKRIDVVATDNLKTAFRVGSTTPLTFVDTRETVDVFPRADRILDLDTDQEFAGVKTALSDFHFHAQRPFLSLAGFKADGIDPTGGNDSAPAAQVAVSECENAGKSLFVDPGIYGMSEIHSPGDENFVTLTKGLNIWARPGSATFIIDETRQAWKAVFGSPVHSTNDLSDLGVYGLTFDAQSHINNPLTAPVGEGPVAGQTRAMIAGFYGGRIRIGQCRFRRQTGRNVIFLVTIASANVMWDAEVFDCIFEDIGTPASWHDHASVYLDGARSALRRCTFLGVPHADGSWSSAWSPFELHGQDCRAEDITVENFASCGLLVSSRAGNIGGLPEGHLARNIRGRNVGSGVQVQPQQNSREWDMIDCRALIAPDQWPTAVGPGTDPIITYPGLERRSGFNLQAAPTAVQDVRIRGGRVRFLPATLGYNGHENAVNWNRFTNSAPVDDIDMHIDGLEVEDCPSSVIRADRVRSLRGWTIENLKVRNLGKAGLGAKHQSLFSVGKQVWTSTRPVGLGNVDIKDVTVIDDQVTSTFKHLIYVDDLTTKVDPTVGTTSGSGIITTTNTNILDAGSLVNHPNLPAGTFLHSVRVFASGSTFNVVEWNASAVASATGSAAADIVSQAPTTSNVRVERPNIQLADGSNPNLLKLEAGESVYINGRSQRSAIVRGLGAADVGSTLLITATGIQRRQDSAPTGNLWLPVLGNPLRLSVPVVAWYDAMHLTHLDDGATLTQWTDISGNARHAPVAAGAPKLWRTGGPDGQPVVRFVPGDAFKLAFTLAAPYTVVLVARHRVSTGTQTWIDGNTLNTGLIQKNSSHNLQLYAGTFLIGDAPGTLWFVAVGIFDGAVSNLRRNGGAGVTGNIGAGVPGGITIGANASFASGVDGDIQDVIVFGGIPTGADLNNLARYTAAKAGATWTRIDESPDLDGGSP